MCVCGDEVLVRVFVFVLCAATAVWCVWVCVSGVVCSCVFVGGVM